MKVSVLKYTGEKAGREISLPEEIFCVEPNDHAIYLDVRAILANKRQGTHKVKERGEVSGSRRKIKRQKGSGTARAGDIKSPIFRGGGRIFGPKPRDYGFKVNRKIKKLARKSVLSYRAKANNIFIIEPFELETHKTRSYLNFLQNLNLLCEKTVFIVPGVEANLVLSSRNIQKARVMSADHLNTYDLLNSTKLLIMESAISPMVHKLQ